VRVLIYDEPAILIDYIASIARKNLVYVFCGRLRSIKTPSQTREGVNVPDKKHREILWGKTCKMNRTEPNGRRLPSKRTTSGRCYTLIGRRWESKTFLGPRTVIFNSEFYGWGKAGFSADTLWIIRKSAYSILLRSSKYIIIKIICICYIYVTCMLYMLYRVSHFNCHTRISRNHGGFGENVLNKSCMVLRGP